MHIPRFLTRLSFGNWLAILFVAGLLARLAVSVFLADNKTLYFEHMLIARSLLDGNGYSWFEWGRMPWQPSALVPPLYVYWCTFFQWLSPSNFLPMYASQAVIAASGVVPAFRIGRKLYSERIALIFAALYAFYPEFVYLHSRAVAESIYVVLVMWMIDRYLAMRDQPVDSGRAMRTAFAAGLLAGVAMLVKEGAAIVGMAIMLALFWKLRPRFATVRNRLVPMALGVVLVLSPWIVRNALVLKDFIPVRTGYAINWWVANHPGTAQNPDAGDPNHVFTVLEENYPLYNAHLNSLLPANERGRSLVYASEVIRFIRNRPGEYLTLCAKRLWYYVWFVPGHWLASNPVYRLSWIGLLLLAIPGMILARRLYRLDAVFPLIIIGYLCLYIPVVIVPRYRVIPAMLMLMFASLTVDWLWTRLSMGK